MHTLKMHDCAASPPLDKILSKFEYWICFLYHALADQRSRNVICTSGTDVLIVLNANYFDLSKLITTLNQIKNGFFYNSVTNIDCSKTIITKTCKNNIITVFIKMVEWNGLILTNLNSYTEIEQWPFLPQNSLQSQCEWFFLSVCLT